MPARNHIDLTVKTMRVLEALVNSADGASLKDVSLRLGLIKSSAFRILFTLKKSATLSRLGRTAGIA
jgi:DNA-binding IclR family transcriptional regulator